MKINTTRSLPDTQVQTYYEKLPGFWHPYDIYLHKKAQHQHKSWGFTQKYLWRARETLLSVAVSEAQDQPLTCPRLQMGRYFRRQTPQPEMAAVYYHSHAWHVCIYVYGLVMRHLHYPDEKASTESLFTVWQLMVQEYPKAAVLPIVCMDHKLVQMLRSQCHNLVTHFKFTL